MSAGRSGPINASVSGQRTDLHNATLKRSGIQYGSAHRSPVRWV